MARAQNKSRKSRKSRKSKSKSKSKSSKKGSKGRAYGGHGSYDGYGEGSSSTDTGPYDYNDDDNGNGNRGDDDDDSDDSDDFDESSGSGGSGNGGSGNGRSGRDSDGGSSSWRGLSGSGSGSGSGSSTPTPTVMAMSRRYASKDVLTTGSSMSSEVDMMMRAYAAGGVGFTPYKCVIDLRESGHWSLWIGAMMAQFFGLNSPTWQWRVWGLVCGAAIATLCVWEIASMLDGYEDLEHGPIVILASLYYALTCGTVVTFCARRFGGVSWLFSVWKVVWQSEVDVRGSSRRLLVMIVLVAMATLGNAGLAIAGRWSGISEQAETVYDEVFVAEADWVQVVFTVVHAYTTAVFLLPLALFADITQTVHTRIRRLHHAVITDARTLPQLVEDYNTLASDLAVVNKVFSPYLTLVFAVQIPLIVICLVALLSFRTLGALTIVTLVIWLVFNAALTFALSFISANVHSASQNMVQKIALHVAAGRNDAHRSEFLFFSTSVGTQTIGIRIAGSMVITFRLMAKVISFIGSLYLLLVGFRTS